MNRIAEKCKEAAGAKASARIGTALHAFSEAVDRGERPPIPPRWRPHIAAWTELLHRYNMEVIEIEKRVIHTASTWPARWTGWSASRRTPRSG
jgi:hypothetical protein